jgi:hypothetical protein
MPDVSADRRTSPRFALILIASVSEAGSDIRISARTSDVSRTGCYVDTLNPIPKGKNVVVRLTRGEEIFTTMGIVTYASPGLGMGICFESPVEPAELAILDRWLEKAANLRV